MVGLCFPFTRESVDLDDVSVHVTRHGQAHQVEHRRRNVHDVRIEPLAAKWEAFGWKVLTVDGHDIAGVLAALDEAAGVTGKPAVIIADTVKGKGVSFAENTAAFHNGIMTREQYDTALAELDRRLQVLEKAR